MRCRQSDDWNQLVHTLAADSTQLRHDDGLRKCCCQSYDVQPSGGGSWSHRSREQRRMSQRQLGWMPQGDISATSRFSDTPRQPHTHPRRHGSSTANSAGQIYTRIGGEGTTRSRTLGGSVTQSLAPIVRALVSMHQDSMRSSLSEGIARLTSRGELNIEGCFVACQGQGRGRGRLSRCENS